MTQENYDVRQGSDGKTQTQVSMRRGANQGNETQLETITWGRAQLHTF